MAQDKNSLIIIVSAPSGSGKTTIVDRILKEVTKVKRSVSYTTRHPRKGEKQGKDYIFISEQEFRKRIENDEFLEYEKKFGNYYGTLRTEFKDAFTRGDDIILSIDVKGARAVKKIFPESISIFIMPPSSKDLKERLKKRATDKEKQVLLRLKESEEEMASRDEYNYLIINDDIEKAVKELKDIIETERKKRNL